MICPKCKSKIKDGSNFCSKFGANCDTIAIDNSESDIQNQENEKHGTLMISLILSIVGGLIAYLSVFHDAFGGASGFTAVVGAFVLLIGVILFSRAIGVSDDVIIESLNKANRKYEREREIREANRIWNDAQRDYDRYNHSRKK